MRNLLDQLYKTKLQLVATIMTVAGVALLLLVRSSLVVQAHWLTALPLGDLGSALFTTGLLAIAFEYINRKDGDERARQQLRQVLQDEAPAIRDAVYDGFAFNAKALKHIASAEVLDRMARNALAVQLGDQTLADDVYADLRQQILQAPERWRDLQIDVDLSAWEGSPALVRTPMFAATVRQEYRVRPAASVLRFVCTGDLAEYRQLQRDPTITGRWYFETVQGLGADDTTAFELVEVTVDGVERPVRRTSRKGSQTYTAHLGTAEDKDVTIAYTYRVLVQRRGHMVFFTVPRPTNGLQVRLSYDAAIRYVNVVDFIASATQPRLHRAPRAVPDRSVGLAFDGWVFPRSGVAFVWVLEAEMQAP